MQTSGTRFRLRCTRHKTKGIEDEKLYRRRGVRNAVDRPGGRHRIRVAAADRDNFVRRGDGAEITALPPANR